MRSSFHIVCLSIVACGFSTLYQGCGGGTAGAGALKVADVKFGEKASLEAYAASAQARVIASYKKADANYKESTVEANLKLYHRELVARSDGSGNVAKMFVENVKVKDLHMFISRTVALIAGKKKERGVHPLLADDCKPHHSGVFATHSDLYKLNLSEREKNGTVKGSKFADGGTKRTFISMRSVDDETEAKEGESSKLVLVILDLEKDTDETSKHSAPSVTYYNPKKVNCYKLITPAEDGEVPGDDSEPDID